jgi:predicted metal-dependent hydrolase
MKIEIDQIIHSRRKSVAIIIRGDGRLVVRAPLRLSNARIREFVLSKTDWILTQQAKTAHRKAPVHTFIEGEDFLYLGRNFPLEIVDDPKSALTLDERFHLRRTDQPQARVVFLKWYKQQARQIITDRVNFFAQKHAYNYSRIRLSSARTRWGSCNSKGSLSFTWRLVMAPIEIIDYVVIHELVHLEIHNHSSSFWKKVLEFMPDYKKRRSWLKENGYRLSWED